MSYQVPVQQERPRDQTPTPNPLTRRGFRVCPECAGPLVHGSGCVTCVQCGWGRCG